MTSWLVLVIRDQNPRKRGGLVTGEMTSTREPRFSVFTLWRQGLASSLFNSVGMPQKLAQKLSETKNEAPLPKQVSWAATYLPAAEAEP